MSQENRWWGEDHVLVMEVSSQNSRGILIQNSPSHVRKASTPHPSFCRGWQIAGQYSEDKGEKVCNAHDLLSGMVQLGLVPEQTGLVWGACAPQVTSLSESGKCLVWGACAPTSWSLSEFGKQALGLELAMSGGSEHIFRIEDGLVARRLTGGSRYEGRGSNLVMVESN